MGINKADQSGERRIVKLVSVTNFLLIEEGIVMFSGGLNGIVLWRVGLNDNPPPQRATPGSPGHLTQ